MRLLLTPVIAIGIVLCVVGTSPQPPAVVKTDSVAANIKMYTHVWDEIINKRRLDLFNN